ncbi:hypothetical protein BBB39_16180 [Bordetella trematum]|nr:hypothetical protein BBB39_16180 [Bordetella trematum]
MTTPNINFKTFYLSLSAEERRAFALEAGTTTGYIEVHLVRAGRIPRRRKMESLWQACQRRRAGFTREQLIQFFFTSSAAPCLKREVS